MALKMRSKITLAFSIILILGLIFYIQTPRDVISALKGTILVTLFSFFTLTTILTISFKEKIKIIVMSLITIITTILFSIKYLYGGLSIGVIGAIKDTNLNETIELLTSLSFQFYIFTIIIISCIYYSLKNITTLPQWAIKYSRIAIMVLFLLNSTIVLRNKEHQADSFYQLTKYESFLISLSNRNIYTSLISPTYLFDKINTKYNKPIKSAWTNVKLIDNKKRKNVYIVNIGESARKDKFHLYGYKYDTTYNTTGIFALDGAISPSIQTRLSVPRILSMNTDEANYNPNLNIIDLANTAGLETYWISNQSKNGIHETPISVIAEKSDYIYFANLDYSNAKPDNILLPEIEKILSKKTDKTKVIFINTMGSHANFCDRTPENYKKIKTERNKLLDCYDNSILYGFDFLVSVRDMIKKEGLSYSMFYFSDHGLVESKSSPFLIHGATDDIFTPKAVEIPFFMITEQSNQEPKMFKRSYNLRKFYATFAEWIGITADQIDYKDSVFHPESSELSDNRILTGSYKIKTI